VRERERHKEKMQYGRRRKKLLIINYNVSFHFFSRKSTTVTSATTAPIDGLSPMRCLLIKISNVNNGNYDMKSTRTKMVKRMFFIP
jgi:hypothetical protein